MKALIAEDNRLHILSMEKVFQDMNIEYTITKNGKDAFMLWQEESFDIVVTDIEMPGMDGFELISRIREMESEKYTYIIVLTVENDPTILEKSFEVGADDFLVKPFQSSELRHRIKAGERITGLFEKQLIIYALAELTEARDYETGEHIERIGSYTKLLSTALRDNPKYTYRMTGSYIENIALSSALHDIGKVGIDDRILKKPGKFTKEERELMKKHVEIGFSTIQSIQNRYPTIRFLKMAAEIARWHHEKYDGTGYPDQLAKDEIPLSAKIVGLADVYDALISERVYKRAYSHEEAKSYILEQSGLHFDPDIVEAFLKCESKFLQISESIKKHNL